MCTSWNSHAAKVNIKMTIIYSVLSFDGVISSKNVPLRQGKYIIIYFVKTRVYIV